ncbi:FliM/FliN family flagellar motor switch protein [Acetobacterium wieringae]|uniref:Flagellar motor switch protein FliM n=1 Tax=Acetobacterium wieringae TaxID=52694 RepID=A0ABY6HJZ3_9FIRM|nr:FliM/FliN family flagellar motor switch protein [Acetobacterium wieringae]UYO63806.1 FliM/FliN family flagellar motor switch protein [Acetobacterium wieringae]VUZ27304.1 Flagellar motor switch protein FliM [Acetobacterium wieringae]
MAEILSQSQIDSLLSSLISGKDEPEVPSPVAGKKVKDYDFRRPKLFTREQLKHLFSIYENYARLVSSHITGILQTYSLVEIIEVEEQQYYEFNNALPDSVLMGLIDFDIKDSEDEEDLVIMDLSKDVGFCSFDRLLGGSGKPLKEDREFTEIEIGVMEYFFRGMINLMKNVWFDYLEISPRLIKIETNSRILQGIGADENVVIIVMSIKVNETQGKINICIPATTLDMLFKKKMSQTKKNIKRGDQEAEEKRRLNIINEIRKTELEIKGVLGDAEVLSQDIYELEVGDIIKLNKPANSMVDIVVNDEVWFRGEMGDYKKKRAIQIKELNERGSELFI